MLPTRQFAFGPFRLDPSNAALWHGTQVLALTPKAFAVLQFLLEHAGELVTKEALFEVVWRQTVVSDGALKVCMTEIRRALQDGPRTPQFIKTEHRRGYRFIANVSSLPSEVGNLIPGSGHGLRSPQPAALASYEVGRQAQLDQLQGWLEQALGGRRQVVFISGDAGIGKTTLVDFFLERVAAQTACWWARGQCIDQHGAGAAVSVVVAAATTPHRTRRNTNRL